ncbi:hypothetical protein BBJ28_00002823 [Nothophytophthora sp. Chile5]|nr:hypothetical protein BBJ28_00002823 [Nothophytophthora sp. Chile5]
MPAYHSTMNDLQAQEACGCSILPIKTRSRGPAPPAPEGQDDIVDEIITLFRANVLFTNYEIKGNADRVLIYGTLFVHLCLKKLDKCTAKTDETIRSFLKQLREAIAFRLVDEVFPNGEKSKWWMFFAKRKFMNKELSR